MNGYYIVRDDDFVYNPRISNYAPVGPIKRNKLGRTGVISPLYYVFRPHDIDKKFLEYYFDTTVWHKFMKINGDSGARADRFAIKDSIFKTMPIPYPSIEEQRKIGKFFDDLNDTIALHQRKLDKLKRLKQGYLQRLFPQNGEKVPRLRFTNFERDWKLCEVGNSAFLRGRIGFRGYKRTDLVPPHQGAITFSPSDIDNDGNLTIDDNDYISLDKYYESPEIKVKLGDILFTKTASIGKIAYVHELKEKATINPQFALLTPNKTVDNYFLFQSLRHPDFLKKVKGITGGSSVQTMSQEKLKDLVFFVPALDEQIKVSDLLLNLNRRILLQQSKLANLKSIKQALLQKMFI